MNFFQQNRSIILKIVTPVLIIALGVISAFILVKSKPEVTTKPREIPLPLVRAMDVQLQDYQLQVTSQGTVKPRTESALVSQVAGQVTDVTPEFAAGGFFTKGAVLLQIDPRDYELVVSRTAAEVAQAELRLAQEEGEAELAREEWEKLGHTGEPHPLVVRKPQLEQARAALTAARASLEQAKLNLERTKIKAPYDGRVLTKNADIGQYVAPGAVVARIYAVDYAEVRLPIPDGDLAYLDICLGTRDGHDPGAEAEVILSADFAGKSHEWPGKIVRVEGEIDAMTRMVHLVARVDDPYDRKSSESAVPLSVGLFVEATIRGRVVRGVAVIPRSALRDENRVLVIDPDNRLHFRQVDILKDNRENAIVKAGLLPGETICLSPLETVVEGMRVRVDGANRGGGQS